MKILLPGKRVINSLRADLLDDAMAIGITAADLSGTGTTPDVAMSLDGHAPLQRPAVIECTFPAEGTAACFNADGYSEGDLRTRLRIP